MTLPPSSPVLELVPRTHDACCQREAVKVLREFLERAERGEIVSVAVVATTPAGTTLTQYSMLDDTHLVVSGLARVQHRIIAASESDGRWRGRPFSRRDQPKNISDQGGADACAGAVCVGGDATGGEEAGAETCSAASADVRS